MGILDSVMDAWGNAGNGTDRSRDAYLQALAGGMLSGRSNNFGVNLGRSMLGAQDASAAERERMAKEQLIQAQVGHYGQVDAASRAEMAAKQRLQAEADRFPSLLAQASRPTVKVPENFVMPKGANPEQSNWQSGGVNQDLMMAAQRLKITPEQLGALMNPQNVGRAEVARTVVGKDDQNRPGHWQLDKHGDKIGGFVPQAYEKKLEDLGAYKQPWDGYTQDFSGNKTAKTMTPEGAAADLRGKQSNAIAAGNLGVSQARLKFEQDNPTLQYNPNSELLINTRTGAAKPATMDGKPLVPEKQYVEGLGFADRRAGVITPGAMADGKPIPGKTEFVDNNFVDTRNKTITPAVRADGSPVPPKMGDAQKKELLALDSQRASISQAIAAATAHPDAFSFKRGLATEAGGIPESMAGRTDTSEQRMARSRVFNEASAVITQRAGMAQTKHESKRINSFLPINTDGATQIIDKLKAYNEYLDTQRSVYGSPVGIPGGGRRFKIIDGSSPSSGGFTVER